MGPLSVFVMGISHTELEVLLRSACYSPTIWGRYMREIACLIQLHCQHHCKQMSPIEACVDGTQSR